jgi:hypothetical protein
VEDHLLEALPIEDDVVDVFDRGVVLPTIKPSK